MEKSENLKTVRLRTCNNVFSLGEREWLTDFALYSYIKSLTPSQSGDQCSVMYSMPFEVLAEIFNSESRAFQKVADKKHNYMVRLTTWGPWAVLFLLGNTKKIYYLDSFGNPPRERILNLSINASFAGKHITAKSSYNIIPVSVVFGAVFSSMCALNT